jgi:2-phosphosulfolactate phosphatase
MKSIIKILWSDEPIPSDFSKENSAIVLVDTLRCSSTLATALYSGTQRVYMAKEIDIAFSLKQQHPNAILAGERGSVKVDGFEATNSPVFFSQSNQYIEVVLSSGNFCNVLEKYTNICENIFSGTLVNAQATAQYLIRKGFKNIYFIAVGTYHMHGEYFSTPKHTSEDFLAAAYIARVIEVESSSKCEDIDKLRDVLDNPESLYNEIQKSEYVAYLKELDIQNNNDKNQRDMDMCWKIDASPIVCILDKTPQPTFIGR